MKYTVVIRTLGTAGEKYQQELDSLMSQTMPPEDIIVYIAEGYPLPKETCGMERYVYVKKGMVAQRALPYNEVKTKWMLMLDDDVYLPPTGVETLLRAIEEHGADVVSPCTFNNHLTNGKAKVLNRILGKEIPFRSDKWAYKVTSSGGFAYNDSPTNDFYWSQTNAGPCLLCRKKDFIGIRFEEDLWLDTSPYALPDDQVMFYKMHLNGMKVATVFNSGIEHLDAGSAVKSSPDRDQKMLYSEYRNRIIFWHKYIKPQLKGLGLLKGRVGLEKYRSLRKLLAMKSFLRGDKTILATLRKADKSVKENLTR